MDAKKIVGALVVLAMLIMGSGSFVHAQNSAGDFSLQVSPSPIIETIKPGETSTFELQVRNTGSEDETLKMGLQAFAVNSQNGEVELKNEPPAEVVEWVDFADPVFTIQSGEWFTQKITVATPDSAGFSYSFAITISRNQATQPGEGQTALEGTVAVFALFTVDKPGAVRSFEISSFSASKKLYEYLPTSFKTEIANTGNTIVQPAGTIFISRPGSNEPIATLPVNPTSAYILPDSKRTLDALWDDGFPVYKPVKEATNVAEANKLTWDFSQVQKFRFGTYEAKIVAVYNDGQRDVPVIASVEFTVFPWKLAVLAVVVVLVLAVGVVTIVRKVMRVTRRKHDSHTISDES